MSFWHSFILIMKVKDEKTVFFWCFRENFQWRLKLQNYCKRETHSVKLYSETSRAFMLGPLHQQSYYLPLLLSVCSTVFFLIRRVHFQEWICKVDCFCIKIPPIEESAIFHRNFEDMQVFQENAIFSKELVSSLKWIPVTVCVNIDCIWLYADFNKSSHFRGKNIASEKNVNQLWQ